MGKNKKNALVQAQLEAWESLNEKERHEVQGHARKAIPTIALSIPAMLFVTAFGSLVHA